MKIYFDCGWIVGEGGREVAKGYCYFELSDFLGCLHEKHEKKIRPQFFVLIK